MPDRIKQIALSNFRGATGKTTLTFNTGKPIVLLFGENGTGKSTVLDAIDLICNQCHGSLQTRSSTKVSDLPSVGTKSKDLKVELVLGEKTWTGTVSGQKITVDQHPSPTAYVLRRSQLSTLVENKPEDRYKRLAKFIDVTCVEKAEDTLRAAHQSAEEAYDKLFNSHADAHTALTNLWEAEGKPNASATDWAKEKAEQDQTELAARLGHAQTLKDALTAVKQPKSSAADSRAKVADREREFAALFATSIDPIGGSSDSGGLVDLLKRAKAALPSLTEPSKCPVCEQGVDQEELSLQLQARIDELAAFDAHNLALSNARQALETARSTASTQETTYLSQTEEVVNGYYSLSPEMQTSLGADEALRAFVQDRHTDQAWARADALVDALVNASQVLDDEITRLTTDQNQFNAIKGYHDNLTQSQELLDEAEQVKQRLDDALKLVRATRIEFTQKILDEICSEVNALYDRIHPQEPLGLKCFRLDPKFKGSLHQDAHFEGVEDIAPQAYFSESHLDTLGFCIYLATVKWANDPSAILVLDDIFTSVDAVHMTRVIDLLTEESKHFAQVFIATHYRQWSDHYRFSAGAANNVDVIELHHWSKEHGIRVRSPKLATEEIRHYIEPDNWDRQIVGSKAGILLEHALDHLTLLYGCSLPRSGEAYTIGALLDGFKKTGAVLKVHHTSQSEAGTETTVVEVKDVLLKLGNIAFIRNRVGCHFNKDGLNVPDPQVEEFAQLTLDLADALTCKHCGSLPAPNKKTTDAWQCVCKKTLTQPLVRP
ncbi:MAG: AAA family ATPase [Fimbriimonadaceae bacterium]|nr:AAA family ATPase [Fimbriimonadaceae bacterium]